MIVLDEFNKVSTKEMYNYLKQYFNDDELRNISFVARYKSQNYWHCQLALSGRVISADSLKEIVVELLSNDSYLDEIVSGRYTINERRN